MTRRGSLWVALLTGQIALSGCLGGAAYVAYRSTDDIATPEMYSRKDKSRSRSIDYFRERLPRPDRVEN